MSEEAEFASFPCDTDVNTEVSSVPPIPVEQFTSCVFLTGLSALDGIAKTRDPVIVERRNLVNISKLIVKELLDTSNKYGRMLDSDHMTLQHFFIVLEHVLRHGLRPKKGLLGPKKELWDILQLIEKLCPEAQDITSNVRNLPVKTHMGRARAWLRIALMQKKLADYLKVLVDHRDDILIEYFEPDALMMSDEAIIIVGLLVGLNVLDCNLCIKEEDLDCEMGVIDFSLYLRPSHQVSISSSTNGGTSEIDNMTTVLDQKNYIEELNRHLNATVANLQAKVEELSTNNTLMKEDLDIAKENVMALMQENAFLKAQRCSLLNAQQIDKADFKDTNSSNGSNGTAENDDMDEIERLRKELNIERKLRQDTERELNIQICCKAEMEVAMKLLEKDIHEKQDTVISLRKQLDDIKMINLEMYRKLQECESSLKHKTDLITKFESKVITMTEAMNQQEKKCENLERSKLAVSESLVKEKEEVIHGLERLAALEGELKVEKEWRVSLEGTLTEEKERMCSLREETAQLKTIAAKYITLQEEHHKLQEHYREQEKALEELGVHLSISKLQVSDLKEEVSVKNALPEKKWIADKEVTKCKTCLKEFNLTRRKHHCRHCGDIFCNECSDNTTSLPSFTKPVRVCDECYHALLERYSVVS